MGFSHSVINNGNEGFDPRLYGWPIYSAPDSELALPNFDYSGWEAIAPIGDRVPLYSCYGCGNQMTVDYFEMNRDDFCSSLCRNEHKFCSSLCRNEHKIEYGKTG